MTTICFHPQMFMQGKTTVELMQCIHWKKYCIKTDVSIIFLSWLIFRLSWIFKHLVKQWIYLHSCSSRGECKFDSKAMGHEDSNRWDFKGSYRIKLAKRTLKAVITMTAFCITIYAWKWCGFFFLWGCSENGEGKKKNTISFFYASLLMPVAFNTAFLLLK